MMVYIYHKEHLRSIRGGNLIARQAREQLLFLTSTIQSSVSVGGAHIIIYISVGGGGEEGAGGGG